VKPHEYEAGTVAMIRLVDATTERRALRIGNIGWHLRPSNCDEFVLDREVADVRPLVVLDVEDRAGLLATLHDSLGFMYAGQPNARRLQDLIDQISAQIKPPKPAEPTGLGAVVEDASGKRFVRYDGDWPWLDGTANLQWQHINAVRVLSEGVPA